MTNVHFNSVAFGQGQNVIQQEMQQHNRTQLARWEGWKMERNKQCLLVRRWIGNTCQLNPHFFYRKLRPVRIVPRPLPANQRTADRARGVAYEQLSTR